MPEPLSTSIIHIDALRLVLSTCLVLVAGLVSVSFRLDMEKRLAVAAVRTVVQLLLIGVLLRTIFQLDNLWVILGLATVMAAIAGRAAVGRLSLKTEGLQGFTFVTLIVCGLATTLFVTKIVVGAHPWYKPQYLIPILGMILGNSLTGLSLCMDSLMKAFVQRREEIETELALGATAWEAARPAIREAVRKGMVPIINSMTVVGLVSIPGMMTGQILSGTDPFEAVKYQIVVMFMLAASVSLSSMGISSLMFRKFFNARHQLRDLPVRKGE